MIRGKWKLGTCQNALLFARKGSFCCLQSVATAVDDARGVSTGQGRLQRVIRWRGWGRRGRVGFTRQCTQSRPLYNDLESFLDGARLPPEAELSNWKASNSKYGDCTIFTVNSLVSPIPCPVCCTKLSPGAFNFPAVCWGANVASFSSFSTNSGTFDAIRMTFWPEIAQIYEISRGWYSTWRYGIWGLWVTFSVGAETFLWRRQNSCAVTYLIVCDTKRLGLKTPSLGTDFSVRISCLTRGARERTGLPWILISQPSSGFVQACFHLLAITCFHERSVANVSSGGFSSNDRGHAHAGARCHLSATCANSKAIIRDNSLSDHFKITSKVVPAL